MTRILVIFGTTDGQTAKVAEAIAKAASESGCTVTLVQAKDATSEHAPSNYDGVIAAGSVHMGGYQRALRHWVRRNARALEQVSNAFVSVCLGVLEKRPEVDAELQQILNRFIEKCGWRPQVIRIEAGAIPYTRYGFLKKWVMKRIAAKTGGGTETTRDYEYTDWAALAEFTRDFVRRCQEVRLRA